ncbi:MAG: hypothetical protein JXR84_27765 [Anaerolineae bacterium]|nr:hypothetical protein [Anaerolineae bacterium]
MGCAHDFLLAAPMAAAPEVGIAQEARKRLAGMAQRVGHPAGHHPDGQTAKQRPHELPRWGRYTAVDY